MFHLQRVSILTRPEGRVQRTAVGSWTASQHGFQSSPVPKDGCNPVLATQPVLVPRFNPHPSRRTGATERRRRERCFPIVSILTRPEGRVQPSCGRRWSSRRTGFNPHPSRRTGATSLPAPSFYHAPSFNPHPSRRTGATAERAANVGAVGVSILTRPEGRVQLVRPMTFPCSS